MSKIDFDLGVVEWRPSIGYHNFGDHLAWLIGESVFTSSSWREIKRSKKKRYVLIGSFLCDYNIRELLNSGFLPVLVACGYRGEALSLDVLEKTKIYGCRGRKTSEALKKVGINVRPVGDPAALLPLIVEKGRASGESILIPHVCDAERFQLDPEDVGVNSIVQPESTDINDLVELVRRISSAKFVLAGAMHAAIVAHAYGVPFAFYSRDGGYLDCPVKWEDWLSSVSSGSVGCHFHSNMIHGSLWYRESARRLRPTKLLPIVMEYSWVGRVRFRVLWGAFLHDLALLFGRK